MKFSIIIRLAAIAVGILSAVLIARDGFKITLNQYLDAILIAYDDALATIAVLAFEPAIKALFIKLHEWFAIDLHLFTHWKHAFVLHWLWFSAAARSLTLSQASTGRTAYLWLWSVICALAAGVLMGTVRLDGDDAFLWSLGGLGLYTLGGIVLAEFAKVDTRFLRRTVEIGIASLIVFYGFFGLAWASRPDIAALYWTAGLGLVVALVALMGLGYIVFGAFDRDGDGVTFSQKWFGSTYARVGIDVLGVLGGAAAIVYVGHLLV